MYIDPRIAIWLNIAYGALSGLSIPTLNALGFQTNAPVILAWAGLGAGILNVVLHSFSSSQPGPLAAAPVAPSAPAQTPAQK